MEKLNAALTEIMLKIMVIPPKQQDQASQLITVYSKIYESLLKQASVIQSQNVFVLLKDHLEAAFKLAAAPDSNHKNRGYQWLEEIVQVCTKDFWKDSKRRTVKTIYTHAIEAAR